MGWGCTMDTGVYFGNRPGRMEENILKLILKVEDKEGNIICESSGEDFVDLVCRHEYEEGDRILLVSSERDVYLNWQVDDALGAAFVYVKGIAAYEIPFGEKSVCYSPKAFAGEVHYLYAEAAREDEIAAYRNLALNPADQHGVSACFPHAQANVETRGESVFAARNAIDGVRANLSHGAWPYGSWGINRQDDAAMRVLFGRRIRTDKVVLYTRADFPHDNWWVQVTLKFSDGSSLDFPLEKSVRGHVLAFPEKEIEWLELCNLVKSEDPSPFPALSQIEVYGWNVREKVE